MKPSTHALVLTSMIASTAWAQGAEPTPTNAVPTTTATTTTTTPTTATSNAGGFDLARDTRARSTAIWIQPAWIAAIGPALSRLNVGAGATINVLPWLDIVVDASVVFGNESAYFMRGNYTAFIASAGVAFRWGPRPLTGWFVSPRLFGGAFGLPTISGGNIGLALEGGYSIQAGPLYLAIVFGIGVGGSFGGDGLVTSNGPPVGAGYNSALRGAYPAMNLSVLRLGFAF